MNLHQFEAQWRQLKAGVKQRLELHTGSGSNDKHLKPDTPADNQERPWRLSLTDIKERLEHWHKHTHSH